MECDGGAAGDVGLASLGGGVAAASTASGGRGVVCSPLEVGCALVFAVVVCSPLEVWVLADWFGWAGGRFGYCNDFFSLEIIKWANLSCFPNTLHRKHVSYIPQILTYSP